MNKKISFGKISSNFGENAEKIQATGTIGTFGPPKAIETVEDDTEAQQMKQVMGISSFGKKAKTFDIKEMVAQVKATAKEITKKPTEDKFEESEDESDDDDEEDEDDLIGPPIPKNLAPNEDNTIKKKMTGNDSDSDSSDEDTVDQLFIPCSHETKMSHGSKAVTAISVDPSGARLASGIYYAPYLFIYIYFFR